MANSSVQRSAKVVQWVIPAAVLSTVAGGVAAAPAAAYTVEEGDTPYELADRFGISIDELLTWNGLTWSSAIYPGDDLRVAAATDSVLTAEVAAVPAPSYEIVAGDTMYAIAESHGLSIDALLAHNGLSRDSIIYPGQILILSAESPALASVADPASPSAPLESEQFAELDSEQDENAARIIGIGHELGVPDRGIAIALATAMVESWLRNLDWGDRDSLGLFQQRPSTGWGTAEQILDRDRSIRVFYGGAFDPNGDTTQGLLDIDEWHSQRFTDAAQAVQISAHPERYGYWETQAHEWLSTFG